MPPAARCTLSNGVVPERSPARVVVIEEDEMARAALGRVLQAAGFEPALYDSAEAFISLQPSALLRCLIVDVHLGGCPASIFR